MQTCMVLPVVACRLLLHHIKQRQQRTDKSVAAQRCNIMRQSHWTVLPGSTAAACSKTACARSQDLVQCSSTEACELARSAHIRHTRRSTVLLHSPRCIYAVYTAHIYSKQCLQSRLRYTVCAAACTQGAKQVHTAASAIQSVQSESATQAQCPQNKSSRVPCTCAWRMQRVTTYK